jgi:hypothetical protein
VAVSFLFLTETNEEHESFDGSTEGNKMSKKKCIRLGWHLVMNMKLSFFDGYINS